MTPERLTGLDASFLYMETPTLHMHVAMTAVFDPSTVPDGYSFRRIRQLIKDRIPLAPVFQRRLVEVPMRLGHPVWVDDPEFDIDNHLRRAALPSPGGMRELGDFAADVISRQLHRDRPLWEMWIVEGLEDGKIALVVKMHHSTIDGVSGAELLGVLFDLEPNPPETHAQRARQLDSRIPSGLELVSQAMVAGLVAPFDVGRMVLRTTRNIFDVRRIRQGLTAKAALPLTAPRTSINVAVHARRRVAFAAASLADAKALKNKMGTTVNDVVLAMCAGALRTYLLAGDELPDIPLVSVVPVSVTPDVAELKGSNKVSAMFVQLPCHIEDPLERLQFIHEGTKGAKEEHQALGATTLAELGRARDAQRLRRGRPAVHGDEAGRPPPARRQPGGVQCPGSGIPALSGRQPDARDVPARPGDGRDGPQHHDHEQHGRPLLGAGLRRPSRPSPVGHRRRRPARPDGAHGGGRARVPALRRPDPSRARHAAHGELDPRRGVRRGRGDR